MQDVEARRAADRERQRRWRAANADRRRAYERERYRRDPEPIRAQVRRRQAALRAEVFAHYGWTCACCGSSENLSIDHIGGDGAEHRMELYGDRRAGSGARWHLWLIRKGFPDGYQTLCMRCNTSKGRTEKCRLAHDAG